MKASMQAPAGDIALAIELTRNAPTFDELVALHQQRVLRTAYRLLGRVEDAQDAAQEVFLRLLKNMHRIDGDAQAQKAVHSDLFYLLSNSTVGTAWPMAACALTPNYAGHAFWDSDSWVFPSLLLLLAMLWGASYSFIKLGVATIPPITLIAARTLIAGVLLLLVMRWRSIKMPRDFATWQRFAFQAWILLKPAVCFNNLGWVCGCGKYLAHERIRI